VHPLPLCPRSENNRVGSAGKAVRHTNLFFWPLIVQFGFFLAEVGFLFFFYYYLAWDALAGRKRLHIFFGVKVKNQEVAFSKLINQKW
jgi:hypothetical protein